MLVCMCVRVRLILCVWYSRYLVLVRVTSSYISLSELKNLMKNLGEGLNDEEIQGMEKVAAADDEEQVNIRHMVDQLMQE